MILNNKQWLSNKLYKHSLTKCLVLLFTIIAALSSCTDTAPYDPAKQALKDDSIIQAYVKKNHIAAVKDPSGLYYEVLQPGTGANATPASTITYGHLNELNIKTTV